MALNHRYAKPEPFAHEISRAVRKNHTRKQFIPAAIYFPLNLWRQLERFKKNCNCSPRNLKRKAAAPRVRAGPEAMI